MKLKIAAFGGGADHAVIEQLAFQSAQSLSDYDGVFFDPYSFNSVDTVLIARRQREIAAFLARKAGVVICYLRPIMQSASSNNYSLFQGLRLPDGSALPLVSIRDGLAFKYELCKIDDPARAYFSILQGKLKIEAHFGTVATPNHGAILALDSLMQMVAARYDFEGGGKLYFVPIPDVGNDTKRVGAAVVNVVRAHYGGSFDASEPEWAKPIVVPTGDQFDSEISRLGTQITSLQAEVAHLEEQRKGIMSFKRLVYGTGTQVLEPAVRSALRLLGFEVLEPDDYEEDWDARIDDPELGYGICEIEGPEGAVDLAKYRQLRDYVDDEIAKGHEPKGFLIGNGYRNLPLEERKAQFTEHALKNGTKQRFCLLPTSELFKAVCAVLQNPTDDVKREIRQSLFNCVGVWSFDGSARTEAATDESASGQQGAVAK